MTKILLQSDGHWMGYIILKNADTITFVTDGKCKLTEVTFTKNAGNFTKQSGADFPYKYDGLAIPATGAEFSYKNDAIKGSGNGVIKTQ
jgi:hypothetical protein